MERATYNKKDKKGPAELRDLLTTTIESLFDWPRVAGCHPEGYPFTKSGPVKAAQEAGWTLHKLEFTVPRADGAARQGRLMILVNLKESVIVPFYVYNHKQFSKRVGDDELRRLIAEAAETGKPKQPEPEPEPDDTSAA